MTKRLIKFSAFLTILIFLIQGDTQSAINNKYQKWQIPSYFRGYNVINEFPKTLQDFIDFRNYGGNYISINTRGFVKEDPPYETNQANINGVDLFVSFCRQTGIYYSIAVRSGPGAYDTYYESQGWTPESRIWNTGNTTEQQLYANMLKMIVNRYKTDTLFVGITFVVEPRPKVKLIPANTSNLYKKFLELVYNIHMDRVYNSWVQQVRSVDPEIPIILENFAYSTPELFPPYDISGNYILYSAHNYQPVQYTRSDVPFDVAYPGVYWNLTYLSQRLYDSTFMANVVFGKLNEFAESSGKPVLIGEFGMNKPQSGGPNYIKDVLGTVKNRGWHFALWEWRNGGVYWSIENFQGDNHDHWKAVLKQFHAPPVPVLNSPVNEEVIQTFNPVFRWDSLTGYTKFDLMVFDDRKNQLALFENIGNASYRYNGPPLAAGKTYGWKVRSKNPGGTAENNSAWSVNWAFIINNPTGLNSNNISYKFKLYQNFPNPFNPSTKIRFSIPASSSQNTGTVMLKVFDVLGREIAVIINEELRPGTYEAEFNGTDYPSGVYYFSITAGTYKDVKKMVMIK